MPDEPILDVVDAADAVAAAELVEPLDQLDRRRARSPSSATGMPRLEADRDLGRVVGRVAGCDGPLVGVGRRLAHGSSSTPVSIERPHRLTSTEYGDALVTGISMPRSCAYSISCVAGHAHADAHRGDDLEPRIERLDGDVEADLVVALAGAAVGDGVGALAWATSTRSWAISGRASAVASGIRALVHARRPAAPARRSPRRSGRRASTT